jgi:DNA-binding NarL/FixJ family response regulator
MIASGKTVGTIAKELSLSVKTVSEYRARLWLKCEKQRRTDALRD